MIKKLKYCITFVIIGMSISSYCQVSQYTRLPKTPVVSDVGFDFFAKAAQARSSDLLSNKNEVNSIIVRVQEIYESKLESGCESNFTDLYSMRYNSIVEKVNSGKIDITTRNGIDFFKMEMYSLEKELIRFNCYQKEITNNNIIAPANPNNLALYNPNIIKSSHSLNYNSSNGTIKTGKVKINGILWSDCDENKRQPVSFIDKNTIVNIMTLCENKGNNQYFIILENGKAGYMNSNDIEY